MPPQFHRTPHEAIAGTEQVCIAIDNHQFQIERPANPDEVLRHPAVVAAGRRDEYLPQWVKLWPAARMLATAVVREPWEVHAHRMEIREGSTAKSLRVLEVGCGLGLAGIACLACGLAVTFSDVDETALTFATANARLNGFCEFRTQLLDFRYPPSDAKYTVVIGSDLIYQDQLVVPLTRLLAAVLAPGGVCLVTDPDRPTCRRFVWHLAEVKLKVETDTLRLDDSAGGIAGTLYRIRNAS
jgi:SAM-dependent methyltransferase